MARYRKGIISGAIAVLCVAVALLPGLRAGAQPAGGGATVPGGVEMPWFWQATVGMDPPGPASVLFGGDSAALYGDPWEEEGAKLAVVGRGGAYRMLRYPGEMRAGQDVRLSPDGNLVASSWLTGGPDGWLIVTDLRTGASRGYGQGSGACCYETAAWRPDSGAMLVLHRLDAVDVPFESKRLFAPARYILVDLRTGAQLPLADVFEHNEVESAWEAAFAPDGTHLALTVPAPAGAAPGSTVLRGYDTTGKQLWTRDLGDRRHLAGAGAYTPDGRAIATVTLDGCVTKCTGEQLLDRAWTVSYVDAATGADAGGPALPVVRGMAVRALGWHGTDLVVVHYEPEPGDGGSGDDTGWGGTRHVRVLALHQGHPGGDTKGDTSGDTSVLLDPPDDVGSIDIAQDLVRDGRFGGPVPSPSIFPVRWGVVVQGALCYGAPLSVLVLIVVVIVRRFRRRPSPAAPERPEPVESLSGAQRGGGEVA
jgi:hypothetical protein